MAGVNKSEARYYTIQGSASTSDAHAPFFSPSSTTPR